MSDLPNLAKPDYVDRVNRAIDHITRHLDQPLRLEDIAQVACFSPYHFHRIFRGLVGETLNDFIKRVRLERAVYLLSHGPKRSLTEIGLACGFNSSSDFSRSFRAHFGSSPRAFDLADYRRSGRERLVATLPDSHYVAGLPAVGDSSFSVTVRQLSARRVAYRRVFQPYEPERVPQAAARLLEWARARNLEGGQWLGWQWEDPEIVPLELCRYDVGVEVPENAVLDDTVSEMRFPLMTVAEVPIAGSIELALQVLQWLYMGWLPRSGYAPDHQPCFEAWDGLPYAHGQEYFEVRAQLPIAGPGPRTEGSALRGNS